MIIEATKASSIMCPFLNGLNCRGEKCGVWRWSDPTHGYCGAGGPVTPPTAPGEADAIASGDAAGRVDRLTTKATAPRRR